MPGLNLGLPRRRGAGVASTRACLLCRCFCKCAGSCVRHLQGGVGGEAELQLADALVDARPGVSPAA